MTAPPHIHVCDTLCSLETTTLEALTVWWSPDLMASDLGCTFFPAYYNESRLLQHQYIGRIMNPGFISCYQTATKMSEGFSDSVSGEVWSHMGILFQCCIAWHTCHYCELGSWNNDQTAAACQELSLFHPHKRLDTRLVVMEV